MLCSRCKKRTAVVFISQSNDMSKTQGLCHVCAKELGIAPVNDLMDKMGITPEQFEAMQSEFSNALAELGGEDGFDPGGAATFPFLQNVFGEEKKAGKEVGDTPSSREKKKDANRPKRKFIGAYCTDLTAKARAGEKRLPKAREKERHRRTEA